MMNQKGTALDQGTQRGGESSATQRNQGLPQGNQGKEDTQGFVNGEQSDKSSAKQS